MAAIVLECSHQANRHRPPPQTGAADRKGEKTMKNYFEGCTTLDALKARYRIMAKELHPDLHPELGDEPMKELNAQFERLSERLSHVAADGLGDLRSPVSGAFS